MKNNLLESFEIQKNDVIGIVGAAGKTTLLFSLGKEASKKYSVAITTTTKIFIPKKTDCEDLFIGESKNLEKKNLVVYGRDIINNKINSSSEDDIKNLKENFDVVMFEADGSKEKSVKGYKSFEPVNSKYATKTIAVISFKALGKKINEENVHNLQNFLETTGKEINHTVEKEDFVKLIKDKNSFFKGFSGKKYIYLTFVTKKDMEKAKKIAKYFEDNTGIKVIIAKYVEKNITAIVLGSGLSRRMGNINKLKLEVKGTPIVKRVTDTLIENEKINEVILVTNEEIKTSIKFNEKVKIVTNNNGIKGISESIKLGIQNAENSNFMFVTGDIFSLSKEIIESLVYRFDNQNITLPVVLGSFKNPVIFPSRYKERLLSLTGDTGGNKIIKEEEREIIKVIFDENVLEDIDTVEEYLNAIKDEIVIVRGGGDIATGTIQKLKRSGFKVIVTEIDKPSAIRRSIALSEAIYDGFSTVEDIKCKKVNLSKEEIVKAFEEDYIPIVVDNNLKILDIIKSDIVVDAILAKKNIGLSKDIAKIVIALGPGFNAGYDCDIVIETNRGHSLGRLIFDGLAKPNTGIPGNIGGFTVERVNHSPLEGVIKPKVKIGDIVQEGDVIAVIEGENETKEVKAKLKGLVRGMIREGYYVTKGFKIADIDARINEYENCFKISDKARNIAGGVLEAILYLRNRENRGEN